MVKSSIVATRTKVYRKKACFFCKEKTEPSFKEVEPLRKFITERGKIVPRAKTGVCASHQRKLAAAIKRSRFLALLPYTPRI